MENAEILVIAKNLFDNLSVEDREQFTEHSYNEYGYDFKFDYSFADIMNEFLNDIEIGDSIREALTLVVMYYGSRVHLYRMFELLTGYINHIDFLMSVYPDMEVEEDQHDDRQVIIMPDNVPIEHALAFAKANPTMVVEYGCDIFGETQEYATFHIVLK